MLTSLDYSVTFPSTGRTLSNSIDFKTGVGLITGPNESGKSLIVEMIRYGLFGSEALRGPADDYRTLRMKLVWSLRDHTYIVERNGRSADLFKDDVQIATGVRPVNSKIQEILGFGLDVFDISCVTNQGDVEKLVSMRPGDRKSMIDRVIGVDKIEALAKWSGDEALIRQRQIALEEPRLVEPVAPVTPATYQPSDAIQGQLLALVRFKAEYDQLVGWLSHEKREPIQPVDTQPDYSLDYIIEIEAKAAEKARLMKELVTLPKPSEWREEDLVRAEKQIEAWELWQERLRFEQRHPRPDFSRSELTLEQTAIDRKAERAQLMRTLMNLHRGAVTCPCGREFELEHAKIAELQQRLDSLPALEATMTQALINEQLHRHVDWESTETQVAYEFHEKATLIEKPFLDRKGVAQMRRINELAGRRPEIEAAINAIGHLPNVSRSEKERYLAQAAVYDEAVASYQLWFEEFQRRSDRMEELRPFIAQIPGLQKDLLVSQNFEMQLAAYERDLIQYQAAKLQLDALKDEATGWRACRAAMTELRSRIKAYLVPSLNRVASHLLHQMTGGSRQTITVDEDFDTILVDGQSIDTLSGSGKACANLALRVGLGQVLTNNVFSLFIGDEIDASMDENRAKNTLELYTTLSEKILQILLVTHKSLIADYTIALR
jgi:DNA repair exonuclease SbcCD ATPase subunit